MDSGNLDRVIPVIACLLAFLIGSIPFGLLVARFYKVSDLREKGSGNIGATNVARVIGFWPAGALTLFLDTVKGAIPVLLLLQPVLDSWKEGVGLGRFDASAGLRWSVGLFAVLGHCYSPWLRFKGGKGVATGLGAILLLSPWGALGGAIAFVVTFLTRRIGSLSSLTGLVVASIVHLVLNPGGAHLWAGAIMVFVITIRHAGNIDALLENREKTF